MSETPLKISAYVSLIISSTFLSSFISGVSDYSKNDITKPASDPAMPRLSEIYFKPTIPLETSLYTAFIF